MIDYPNRIQDHETLLTLRKIIDGLNAQETIIGQNSAAISKIAPPLTLDQIKAAIQLGGTHPINVTGLLGTLQSAQATVIEGTHATRSITPASTLGTLFWETDRTVLYTVISSGGGLIWHYAAGNFSALLASKPTGLGAADAGFLFHIQDYAHIARWDGAAWRLTEGSGGYIVAAVATLGSGYQLCDGTATDYILDNTSNLAVSAFTTPNLNGTPGTYLGSIAAYTGVLNAATVPTFTGNMSTTGAPLTTVSVQVTTPTVNVGDGAHDHNFTPSGTIALPADPIANLGVKFYFRR